MTRMIVAVSSVSIWLYFGILVPVVGYNSGTSRNISVEVIAEPFKESDVLVYKWSGDVHRSCPIEIRRRILDSRDVVTNLRALSFGGLPDEELGLKEYDMSVEMPVSISEGPAAYFASEIPKCSWLQRMWPVVIHYPVVNFTVSK